MMQNKFLDFEIQISDFAVEREIQNGFHFREISPQCRFYLRNPNPDIMNFLFVTTAHAPVVTFAIG